MGIAELLMILVVVLIVYGPGKLPQVGAALGKGISEFKKAARDLEQSIHSEPEPPPPRLKPSPPATPIYARVAPDPSGGTGETVARNAPEEAAHVGSGEPPEQKQG